MKSVRLPDELTARLTAAKEQCGAFSSEAEARYARIISTGETIPWEEMRAYLEGRMAGKALKRPTPRKLGR